ncbi:hypothetical protein NPIL_226961, partial [Nephila pilipes]
RTSVQYMCCSADLPDNPMVCLRVACFYSTLSTACFHYNGGLVCPFLSSPTHHRLKRS